MFAKAPAEYRAGRYNSTVTIVEGEAAGVLEAARQKLAEAIAAFDWSPEGAKTRESWIIHIIRREAEALILTGP
jgi:hypothetical protein